MRLETRTSSGTDVAEVEANKMMCGCYRGGDNEEFGSRTFGRCRLFVTCVNQIAGIFSWQSLDGRIG
jgi:hypothetical protein